MENLTLEDKLDKILWVLTLSPRKSINNIQDYLNINQDITLSNDEVKMLTNKIKEDGYITISEQYVCELKYEGKMYEKLGGYRFTAHKLSSQDVQRKIDAQRLIDSEIRGLDNQDRLNTLTHRLVIASWCAFGVALALLIFQLIVYFFPRHSDAIHVILNK